MVRMPVAVVVAMAGALGACTTHVVIDQPKPLEITVNLNANVNVVLQDARQNLEQITGEKPKNVVRPEDIGLAAPAPQQGSAMDPLGSNMAEAMRLDDSSTIPVLFRTASRPGPSQFHAVAAAASEQELTRAMAARNAKIQALWAEGMVGESHTGLLVARAKLSEEQQKLVDAENADRGALYATEAARRNIKADDVAVGYYLARLGYAKAGAWYEVKTPAGQWEWKQWGK